MMNRRESRQSGQMRCVTHPACDGRPRSRPGTVLIVTIWVVLVLAGLVLVFARSSRVAAVVAANHVASLQADMIAAGALEYIKVRLGALTEEGIEAESSDLYEAQQVGDGYFWVLRSNLESSREFTFGLTDEAGKINLNSASLEMLQRLPGMTAELAASIIDWRDEDSDVTPGGAESEYYLLQPEPYQCKNAPLETIDEILLIKGGSREILYGEDLNGDGRLDGGFYDYVTVYSVEANVDAEGEARVNINDASARSDLQRVIREATNEDRALEIMGRVGTNPNYANILAFYFQTGMTYKEFSQIADRLTTRGETTLPGLVNVNTAPKEVLLCLPGLEESDAEALVAYRAGNGGTLDSIAWVTEVLDQEKATGIGSYITVRSFQYSADIVCLSGNGRAYKRYRAVLDVQTGSPRVIYWRNLTHFGWPLQPEIMAALRDGQPLKDVVLSMY